MADAEIFQSGCGKQPVQPAKSRKKSEFWNTMKEISWCTVAAAAAIASYQALSAPEPRLNLAGGNNITGMSSIPRAEGNAQPNRLENAVKQGRKSPSQINDISFIIDPGHGGAAGENAGTTILGYGIPERDYCLDTARSVVSLLNERGYSETKATRTGNSPNLRLDDRLAMFESETKNIGVSIHINGAKDKSARGVRVYYNNPESGRACKYVADSLYKIFGKADTRPNYSWRVMRAKNPVVYIELGFGGSNEADAKILIEKKAQIAEAIADALDMYYSESFKRQTMLPTSYWTPKQKKTGSAMIHSVLYAKRDLPMEQQKARRHYMQRTCQKC